MWNIPKNNEYKIFVSPSGEKIQKKPHYHLLLSFSTPIIVNRVVDLSVALGSNGCAEMLSYPKTYYKYLTHAEHPNKAQYSESDIRYSNDFAWYKDLPLPNSNILSEWKEAIENFIYEKKICSLIDLKRGLRELAKNNIRPELFYFVDVRPAEWDRMCRANLSVVENKYRQEIKKLKQQIKEKEVETDTLKALIEKVKTS